MDKKKPTALFTFDFIISYPHRFPWEQPRLLPGEMSDYSPTVAVIASPRLKKSVVYTQMICSPSVRA